MEEPLKFSCNHCRTVLSVPAAFAGVTAPCPLCGYQITAPHNTTHVATPAKEHSHVATKPQFAHDADEFSESLAAVVKPARSNLWLRIAIPVTVTTLLLLCLYGLTKVMKGRSPAPEPVAVRKSIPLAVPVSDSNARAPRHGSDSEIAAVKPQSSDQNATDRETTPHLPKPPIAINPAQPSEAVVLDPTPGVKHAVAPDNGAIEVAKLVDQFLSATSYAERKNIITTKRQIIELEQSILAKPFPSYDVNAGAQIPIADENLTEFYYEIRFYKNDIGLPKLCTLLIQKRGSDPAKIIVDPFLDIVDGRLANFAKHSQDGLLDFYVIMDPRVKCFDDNVPNAFKKSTFYLRAHSNGDDIATAYATEVSSVRQLFNDPTSGLKWKLPIPVVVTLQWNKNEDKQRPFLELVNIKALNWSGAK